MNKWRGRKSASCCALCATGTYSPGSSCDRVLHEIRLPWFVRFRPRARVVSCRVVCGCACAAFRSRVVRRRECRRAVGTRSADGSGRRSRSLSSERCGVTSPSARTASGGWGDPPFSRCRSRLAAHVVTRNAPAAPLPFLFHSRIFFFLLLLLLYVTARHDDDRRRKSGVITWCGARGERGCRVYKF